MRGSRRNGGRFARRVLIAALDAEEQQPEKDSIMNHSIALLLTAALLAACTNPNQNRYGFQDVGHASEVMFGTLISSRPVDITGQNTGVGTAVGATGGAIAGAGVGNGRGQLGAMLAGALIAGIAGHFAEQAISDHTGIEYVVTLRNGTP